MKYLLALEIDAPRDRVVALYVDPEHWSDWQESLVGYETLSGSGREAGSETKIINKFGRNNVEIVETVEVNELPSLYTCIYEARGIWNRVENRFADIGEGKTRWEFGTEFQCTGLLKILSTIMPGMFRRASLKEMKAFKVFAEQHQSRT